MRAKSLRIQKKNLAKQVLVQFQVLVQKKQTGLPPTLDGFLSVQKPFLKRTQDWQVQESH